MYNDLKLDNVIVGDAQSSPGSLAEIRLIDFGLCTRYLDSAGAHIKFNSTQDFIGNPALSSKHAMNFLTVSRRDDLISLTYLLVYMVVGRLDFLSSSEQDNLKLFKIISKKKNEQTPEQLCQARPARPFLHFTQEIHAMDFEN